MSDKIKVTLTVSRAGPGFSQMPGDEVEVGLIEAGLLHKRGSIKPLDAKALKLVAKAEAAAGMETASLEEKASQIETAALEVATKLKADASAELESAKVKAAEILAEAEKKAGAIEDQAIKAAEELVGKPQEDPANDTASSEGAE